MPNLRDIKNKTRGVRNIQQITSAMKLVATARLRQAQDRIANARRYLDRLEKIFADLCGQLGGRPQHMLCQARPLRAVGVAVIAGERGLCGSFNQEALRAARLHLESLAGCDIRLLPIGRKAIDGLRRRSEPRIESLPQLLSDLRPESLRAAIEPALRHFELKLIDAFDVVYAHYISPLRCEMRVLRLLPVVLPTSDRPHGGGVGVAASAGGLAVANQARGGSADRPLAGAPGDPPGRGGVAEPSSYGETLFEPSGAAVVSTLVPLWLEGRFSLSVIESAAAEQGARMVAMGAATDKAQELLGELTLTFNRTRQATITRELAEVVAGAEAQQQ